MNVRRPALRRPGTLRGRLALLALALSAVWVAGLTVTFNLVLHSLFIQQADQQLRTRAAATAATVGVGADGALTVQEASGDSALDTGVWIYQGKTSVELPVTDTSLTQVADALAGQDGQYVASNDSRLYAVAVRYEGRQVGTVVTAVSMDAYTFSGQVALAGSVALGLLLLACVYLATRMAVRRALRPVAEMSASAAHRSAGAVGNRFGSPDQPAELAELGTNLDALLDRITALLRDEQRLTAELSHELRTPLSRVCAETEWLGRRPRSAAEQRASHKAIAEAAERMRVICQTLLTDTRPGLGVTEGWCRVDSVLELLARRTTAAEPAITVQAAGDEMAAVPPAVLERILSPLLDNACRYAADRVTLACRQTPGGVEISVADDGPGVPAALTDEIFQAGRRADPADGHDGPGLGLPLARRLARAAGGDVVVAEARGGARFEVTLPRS